MDFKIKNGFKGQRLVIYPFNMIDNAMQNPLTSDLVVQSMGYFPNAEHHFVDCKQGCDEYVLLYCYKGKGFCVQDGKRHDINQQQFYVLPPHQAFQYGSSKNHPWHLYIVHFKGTKASKIYELIKDKHDIDTSQQARVSDRTLLFDELLNIMETPASMRSLAYVSMCFNQLIASFIFTSAYSEARFPKEKVENNTFLSQVLKYMNDHIDDKITISDMAQELGYSDSYFYRLFYKQMKQAPMSYYMNLKIKRACELLSETYLQINQVAMKIGFEDSYYFSRFFKKQTGMSPKQYREQHKGLCA